MDQSAGAIDLDVVGAAAKAAARKLAVAPTVAKDEALRAISRSLRAGEAEILDANAADVAEAQRRD
ncbi:MAG TPA: hypothetical protein VN923_03110, partial [Thermoanaerobaculia bacterium]|nr:hypothetical protein [Thermoanaerobaculia bacterium]